MRREGRTEQKRKKARNGEGRENERREMANFEKREEVVNIVSI